LGYWDVGVGVKPGIKEAASEDRELSLLYCMCERIDISREFTN